MPETPATPGIAVANEALAVATAYLRALGGDEPDAVADLVAEGFVNEHQNTLGSGCVGRETYRQRLAGFFAGFPGRTYDIDKISVGQPNEATGVIDVVARYRLRTEAVVGGSDADVTRTVSLDIPGVMWIEVANGEVVRRVDTWDAMTYFEQSGDTPPGFTRRASDAPPSTH